jgi:hypothetical protein
MKIEEGELLPRINVLLRWDGVRRPTRGLSEWHRICVMSIPILVANRCAHTRPRQSGLPTQSIAHAPLHLQVLQRQ